MACVKYNIGEGTVTINHVTYPVQYQRSEHGDQMTLIGVPSQTSLGATEWMPFEENGQRLMPYYSGDDRYEGRPDLVEGQRRAAIWSHYKERAVEIGLNVPEETPEEAQVMEEEQRPSLLKAIFSRPAKVRTVEVGGEPADSPPERTSHEIRRIRANAEGEQANWDARVQKAAISRGSKPTPAERQQAAEAQRLIDHPHGRPISIDELVDQYIRENGTKGAAYYRKQLESQKR